MAVALAGIAAIHATECEAQANPVSAAVDENGATSSEPAVSYFFHDLRADAMVFEGQNLRYRPIVAVVADYTIFDQDTQSVAQVGKQEDSQELRAARIGLLMQSKSEDPWEFAFAADYQERRTRDDQVFQLYDLRFRFPVGRMKLDIGKQKQPFVHEVVGLSITNPQQERILSPFFVSRSIGVKISGPIAGDRMTWAAGWFNDWLENDASFSDNANDYVARVTGLVSASPDNREFLHLGLALRRVGPDAGTIRFSGRPESNVADKYVDTGEFPAGNASETAFELAWQRGPFALTAEHVATRTDTPQSGDPRFSGSYLMLSWTLTGETRIYNRNVGFATPYLPSRRYGALELVFRYSHIDLSDTTIDGGVLDKLHLGINWWSSRQWKVGLSYGDADLARNGSRGNTRMLLTRIQWYY